MAALDVLVAFAAATAAFAIYPGPALLYAASQTLARGRRTGLLSALGIHLGCYVHVAAATLGLSALLQAVPSLYIAFKVAGAVYLIWLGIDMLRRRDAPEGPGISAPKTTRRVLLDSFVVELLNPKVAFFFLAFLPQFVDPSAAFPAWLQFLILGIIVNLSFTSADLLAVFGASFVAGCLSGASPARRWMQRVGGGMMIGLGLKLAADRT